MVANLLLCLFAVARATYEFTSLIPVALQPPVNTWTFAFNLVRPDATFAPSLSGVSQLAISQVMSRNVSFGVSTDTLSANQRTIDPGVIQVPYYAFGVLIQINIPGLPSSVTIVLRRSTLSEIFLGHITRWNHEEIVNLNQNAKDYLIDTPIYVVYRNDSAGINTVFSQALGAFSSNWTYSPSAVWPTPLRASNTTIASNSALDSIARCLVQSYSIAYVAQTYITQTSGLQFVSLINKAGRIVKATENSVIAAMSAVKQPSDYGSSLCDTSSPIAWPIVSLTYIIVASNPNASECDYYRVLYEYFHWTYTDSLPRAIGEQNFAYLPPDALTELTLNTLNQVYCDGTQLLSVKNENKRAGPAFAATLAVSVVLLVLVLTSSVVHIYKFRYPAINVIYAMVFFVGSWFTLSTPIAWMMEPRTINQCLLRIWCPGLGFSIILGTMFSRTWQLREIYLMQKKKLDALTMNITLQSSLRKLIITLVVIVCIEIIFLTLWSTIDPYHQVFTVHDNLNLVGSWSCYSNYTNSWLVGQVVFIVILICWGLFVLYSTWDFQKKTMLVETKWVLIALYNIILSICALTPVIALRDLADPDFSLAISIFSEFAGGGIILAFLLPRLIEKIQWSTHSHSMGSTQNDKHILPNGKKGGSGGGKDGNGSDSESSSAKKDQHTAIEPYKTKNQKRKSKKEISKTPPDQLIQKLERPQKMEWKEEEYNHRDLFSNSDRENTAIQSVSYAITTAVTIKTRGSQKGPTPTTEIEMTGVQEDSPLDMSLGGPSGRRDTAHDIFSPRTVKPIDEVDEKELSEKTPLTGVRHLDDDAVARLNGSRAQPTSPLKRILRDLVTRTHTDPSMDHSADGSNKTIQKPPLTRSISSDEIHRAPSDLSTGASSPHITTPSAMSTNSNSSNTHRYPNHPHKLGTKEKSDDEIIRHLSTEKAANESDSGRKKNLTQNFNLWENSDKIFITTSPKRNITIDTEEHKHRRSYSGGYVIPPPTHEHIPKIRPLTESGRRSSGRTVESPVKPNSRTPSRRVTPNTSGIEFNDLMTTTTMTTTTVSPGSRHPSAEKRDMDWHNNPLSKPTPVVSRSNSASSSKNTTGEWPVY